MRISTASSLRTQTTHSTLDHFLHGFAATIIFHLLDMGYEASCGALSSTFRDTPFGRFAQRLQQQVSNNMLSWNSFFHSRFGPAGMKRIGWLRIFYAFLFLADRLCLSTDLDFLFNPATGVLNYHVAQQNPQLDDSMWTLFALAPDSEWLLWGLHYLGYLQGLLLLLGVAPKFQLVCLYINMLSFQHHNHMLWDGEDRMFKLWAFLFLFFPMHTVTIFDKFGQNIKPDQSWPMWPVRIFQVEMTLVYMGASLSKINSRSWAQGTAMYWISYTSDYYPGVFNPDFLFNYMAPLKLFCWSAMVLEVCGWTLVWIPATRFFAVLLMFALHVGIDLTMNMYAFEWLAIIGWCVFLVQPTIPYPKPTKEKDTKAGQPPNKWRRMANIFSIIILSIFTLDAFPVEDVEILAPRFLKPLAHGLEDARARMYAAIEPTVNRLGLQQGVWNMYTGEYPDSSNCYYKAELFYANGTMLEWNSPDWITKPWWWRKMKMRLMNYYDSGEVNLAAASWVAFAKHLINTQSGEGEDEFVGTVNMILRCETGVDFPEDIGWFEPVRQPMEHWTTPMVTVDVCGDDYDECPMWKEQGLCVNYPQGMLLYCQKTCDICTDYIVSWPMPQNARHYEAEGNEIYPEWYDRFPPPQTAPQNPQN